jgi:hypothetical protein
VQGYKHILSRMLHLVRVGACRVADCLCVVEAMAAGSKPLCPAAGRDRFRLVCRRGERVGLAMQAVFERPFVGAGAGAGATSAASETSTLEADMKRVFEVGFALCDYARTGDIAACLSAADLEVLLRRWKDGCRCLGRRGGGRTRRRAAAALSLLVRDLCCLTPRPGGLAALDGHWPAVLREVCSVFGGGDTVATTTTATTALMHSLLGLFALPPPTASQPPADHSGLALLLLSLDEPVMLGTVHIHIHLYHIYVPPFC